MSLYASVFKRTIVQGHRVTLYKLNLERETLYSSDLLEAIEAKHCLIERINSHDFWELFDEIRHFAKMYSDFFLLATVSCGHKSFFLGSNKDNITVFNAVLVQQPDEKFDGSIIIESNSESKHFQHDNEGIIYVKVTE